MLHVTDNGNLTFQDLRARPLVGEAVAQCRERFEDAVRVLRGALDENVDVLGRARVAVEDARNAANDQVFGLRAIQRRAHGGYARWLCFHS